MHGISYRPTDLFLLKEFSKKSVLKIFIILFEQDCPEAVVHGQCYGMNLNGLGLSNIGCRVHIKYVVKIFKLLGAIVHK